MTDISDKSEQQSLQKLEAQKGVERERLRQTLDRAEEARPPEPSSRKIEQFKQNFGDKPGADHVIEDAKGENWSKRVGADHHMAVAQELDGQVESFEEPIHPERTGKMNNIDIVTADDYAVECKASWGDEASPSTVRSAYRQAETRFEPNTEGKTVKGVVVVFSDGKVTGEAAQVAQRYEANNPQIRFCEKSQVNQVLDEMRARAGGR
jgi:hypothetical protein